MSGTKAGAAKRLAAARPAQRGVNLLKAQPVATGVDTLHLHAEYEVRPEVAAELEGLKAEALAARENGEPMPTRQVAGHALSMAHHGTGRGPYLLSSDELAVMVNPNAPKGLPTVLIELRALFLWAKGHEAAAIAAEDVVRDLCLSPDVPQLQVSRIDIAVDFVGWQPKAADMERFFCRAQSRSQLHEEWRRVGGRTKVVQAFRKAVGLGDSKAREVLDRLLAEDELVTGIYCSGRTFTGFGWGAGAVVARMYLKTREIVKSGKLWMVPIWKRGGYRGGPVWRLEFQLRRELLKEACAEDTVQAEGDVARYAKVGPRALVELSSGKVVRPRAVFTTVRSALPNLRGLWQYLMTEWLSLRLPRTADKRVRLAAPWRALRSALRFRRQASPEVWRAKLENDHLRTLGQQAGYMARGIAELVALKTGAADAVVPDDDADVLVNEWVQKVRDHSRNTRGDVLQRAAERWDGMMWRRTLYGLSGDPTKH